MIEASCMHMVIEPQQNVLILDILHHPDGAPCNYCGTSQCTRCDTLYKFITLIKISNTVNTYVFNKKNKILEPQNKTISRQKIKGLQTPTKHLKPLQNISLILL